MSDMESAISGGFYYCPASPVKKASTSRYRHSTPVDESLLLFSHDLEGRPLRESSRPLPRSALRRSSPSGGLRDRPKSVRLLGSCIEEELARAAASTPLALRKNRTSSLERLRSSLPPSFAHARRSLRVRTPSPHRVQRSGSTKHRGSVSSVDAEWFLQLPAKVRSRHFTRDEQALLAAKGQNLIQIPAESSRPRLRHISSASVPDIDPSSARHRRSQDMSSPSPRISALMNRDSVYDSLRQMDGLRDLDLRLQLRDPTQPAPTAKAANTAAPRTWKPARRRSVRRPARMATDALRKRAQSTSLTLPSAILPKPRTSMQDGRPLAGLSRQSSIRRAEGTTSPLDPEATYYQDPSARLKLRQFLASPRRFDEAIEFGFPASADENKENSRPGRPSTQPQSGRAGGAGRTFFDDDDSVSLSENGDESSVPDSDLPRTPSDLDATFRHSPARIPPSTSASAASITASPPVVRRDPIVKVMRGPSFEHREMTLRMTLTKPELRADEDTLYGWQGRASDDPLALDGLSPTLAEQSHSVGVSTGYGNVVAGPFGGPDGWGPLSKDDSIVKRFFRKMNISHRR